MPHPLQISYTPFLFECWFHKKIKDETCQIIVKNGIISLTFAKEEDEQWTNLFSDNFGLYIILFVLSIAFLLCKFN